MIGKGLVVPIVAIFLMALPLCAEERSKASESTEDPVTATAETSTEKQPAESKEPAGAEMAQETKKERVVEIKSARSTEYVKEDGTTSAEPTEFVKFLGDVQIEVTEGASISKIGADEILYNKSRSTLDAKGNVTYEHSTGKSGKEQFKGEALLFDIDKQEGVFLKGAVSQDSGKKNSDPYIVHAEVTGRDSGSTMAFKKGVLTTCNDEDPHWSINATRIWLLPGNEIAILNGVFFIGPLPVFYIPFFYYPSDEMIIHPSFGFRNREGYFAQTTTYLYGRKPIEAVKAGEENSFANFLQGDTLKKQERHGLFLKNLDEDAKDTDPDYFKVMIDGYSALGAGLGLAGSFKTDSYVKSLSFNTMVGFSRTLYPPDSGIRYSTYDKQGEQHYNKSWLFGNEMPFRYRNDFSMSVDKKPFSLSVSLPLISDQEFKNDFQDRSETQNWIKLLTEHDKLSKGTTTSDETSFTWNVNGSVTPDVSFASPWLTTASISSIAATMSFNSKANASLSGEELTYAPGKTFFYPEIFKPSVKVTLEGTVFSSDYAGKKKTDKSVDTGSLPNPLKPADIKKDGDGQEPTSDDQAGKDNDADPIAPSDFLPPGGSSLIPAARIPESGFSIKWGYAPTLTMENRYDPSEWNSPGDIDWNAFSSEYYQFASMAKLTESYEYDKDFLSITSTQSFTNTKQEHTKLSGPKYDTDAEREAVELADYTASGYTIESTEGVKLIPFNRNPFYRPTSVSWDFTSDIVRSVFNGTAKNPTWKRETFEWEKEYIDVHAATMVLGVAPGNYEQKLTLKSNLPPLLKSYTGTASMAWRYGTLTSGTRLYEKSEDDKTYTWDPLSTTVAWTLPYSITFTQEYVYDIEEGDPSRLNLTGGIGPFSMYYTLTNTVPYKLTESGWVLDGNENEFIPTAMGCSFNNSSKPLKLYSWKNRVALQSTLSSSLKFDLNRLTESSFDFVPKLILKISDFLDLSFSSTSSNEVIARYFQQWLDLPEPMPGESNAFKDLSYSFYFWDKQKREQSGFKLKTLSFAVTHYLHDWTATFDTTLSPELKTEGKKSWYDFTPTIKFVVSWKPISDIKTTVKSEESVFSLNTTSEEETTTTTTTTTGSN